jgi:pimeloyl-ACP methyl ester carboxylesterase
MPTTRSHDGTTIAFDLTGDGPPLIVVGGPTQHRAIDRTTPELAALLAPRFTVCAYDRRGRGDSGDTPPYAVEREVEDLAALIDALGGSASVFGMSSGGALALEAAAAGLAIDRLAVYEPPYMVGRVSRRPPHDHRERLAALAASDRPGEAVEYFVTAVAGLPRDLIGPLREAPVWPALERVAPTLAYDAAIMGDYSLPIERLGSVTQPTLVISGDRSDPRLRKAVRALWVVLPDVEHRVLEGQTHDVAPFALAPALDEFFGRAALAPTGERSTAR